MQETIQDKLKTILNPQLPIHQLQNLYQQVTVIIYHLSGENKL